MRHSIEINRAPVLTLWAAVVAHRLGFEWEEALTLGRAVAGLNAYTKGKALVLFEPTPEVVKEKASPTSAAERGALDQPHEPQSAGHSYGCWNKGAAERTAD